MRSLLFVFLVFPACTFLATAEDMDVDRAAQIAGQTEPYKPSWIGWLHLPPSHPRPASMVLGREKPDFWKSWERAGFRRLEWVPAAFQFSDAGRVSFPVYSMPDSVEIVYVRPDVSSKRAKREYGRTR